MTDRTDRTDKDHRMRLWLLLLLGLLIIGVVIVAFLFGPKPKDNGTQNTVRQSVSDTQQAGGDKFDHSDFYHATGGEWIISDDGILVLKEQKFISKSEIERYAVHKITPRDRVRMVQSSQRWKKCQVLRDGKIIAEGWIDANFVRNVKRFESSE
jgi:hypothetical protein